jgi:hypothetical protein
MEPTDRPASGINTEVPTLDGDSHSTVDGPKGRTEGEDEEVPPLTTSEDGTGKPDADGTAGADEQERDRRPST